MQLILTAMICTALADSVKTDTLPGVSVSAHRHVKEAAAAIQLQTATAAELHDLGITSLSDAIRRFAGTEVKDYGGIGGMKTVSLHNLGAAHTAVSYDGICISQVMAGQTDIGRLQTDNIETIALAVGQYDDMLATAQQYASAALLKINTKTEKGMTAKIRAGSFGLLQTNLSGGLTAGSTDIGAYCSFLRADGQYPFTLENGKFSTEEKRYNSNIRSITTEINAIHHFNDSATLKGKIYYYSSKRALPGAVILYNPEANEQLRDDNFFAQATYENILSKMWALRINAKYSYGYNRYNDENPKYPDGKYQETARQNEVYANATLRFTPIQWLQTAIAQDFAYAWLNTDIYDNLKPSRVSLLTTLAAKAVYGRFTANASLTATQVFEYYNKFYFNPTNEAMPEDKKKLSPCIAVAFRPINNHLSIRAMYKETFRVPAFNDLYYRQMGTLTLHPEKAREWSAGITATANPQGIIKDLFISIDAYINNVDDKIVAFPSTYVWKMANFGKVRITGIDITAQTALQPSKDIGIDLKANLTFCSAKDKTDPDMAFYDMQLPYTPKRSGSISAVVKTPWLTAGYLVILCAERYATMVHTQMYRLKPYADHSITLTKDIKIKTVTLTLQGKINNITNCQYEIVRYYPMPGRNYEISVKCII